MTRFLVRAGLAVLLAAVLLSTLSAQQDLPRFRSSVEVTSLDVSVFDGEGRPIVDLSAEDFAVAVDGTPRRVVSAEWIRLDAPEGPDLLTPPPDYSSNQGASGGRLILIVIDQPNIRFGGTLAIRKAVNGFVDRLRPSDRAAIVGVGAGSSSTPFTADRERLKSALERMVGQYQSPSMMLYRVGVAEAVAIQRGSTYALQEVLSRECRDMAGRPLEDSDLEACQFEIQHQVAEMARSGAADGRESIAALRHLLTALRAIDAPKTLVFVSEGFLMEDDRQSVMALGALASAARTSIYALRLDDQLFALAAAESRAPISQMDDRAARSEGLEILTSASRGSMFNVIGAGSGVFERIETELAGYYLVGIESGSADKDGKAHPVRVEVRRRGLTVRTRRALLSLPDDFEPPKNPREAVQAALATPLPLAALPIRVATFSLQGPEADKVQVLIHAEVGTDYASARLVSLGYVITDRDGLVVDSQAATARLAPVMNGVPSALRFSGGASVSPGKFVLKLAVAEGDRTGTVEHTFNASLASAGSVHVSDLLVGGPLYAGAVLLRPTVGHDVLFGAVHGYFEAYGDGAGLLHAKYEIASVADGSRILEADVAPVMAGSARAIFTRVMPVRQLPPGEYLLRATLSSGAESVKSTTRRFSIAAPAVLMTSASTAPSAIVNNVYLPVTELMMSPPFNVGDAARPATLKAFRDRVPEVGRPAFDRGVEALVGGAYADAEASFKRVVSADDESSAALAYMAAAFAASGHDTEAVGAWQTALIGGSDLPEIYDWLISALLRTRDLPLARSMLEEAMAKWPSDLRFARPMALVFAIFGQGPEAVRTLERYLAARGDDDVDALQMGVEWLYQLRSAGAVAHSPSEDVLLARTYADAYTKAGGSQGPLVKQWIEFLERQK